MYSNNKKTKKLKKEVMFSKPYTYFLKITKPLVEGNWENSVCPKITTEFFYF